MKLRFIPALTALSAALAVSIFNIMQKVNTVSGLKRLLVVLVLFYILGLIARMIVKSVIDNQKSADTKEEETTEETELEDASTNDN